MPTKTITPIKPTYNAFDDSSATFMGTVIIQGKPNDIYYLPCNPMDSIVTVHGNQSWEYSTFNCMDLLPDFNGTPTFEVARHFYFLAQKIIG